MACLLGAGPSASSAIVIVKVGLMSNPGAGPDGVPSLTIGAVAKLAGKSASAIRYYEQIGLLPGPARAAGRRRYGQATVRTLAVIETAQRAGLALDEIKVLLSASPGDRGGRRAAPRSGQQEASGYRRPDRAHRGGAWLARMCGAL